MNKSDGRRFIAWAAGLALFAVVFRLVFFLFALRHIPFTWDEGWPSLMALHILKGEFPVVYWGQTYMGTQESYFQALCIALLGAKTWVVRLYPFFFGLGFVAVMAWLAERLYGRRTALITLALLAIPVPYLTIGSVLIPPDNYLPMTALGTLALVLTHDLAFLEDDARRRLRKTFWLGFLLGYTFWLHILALSYIGVAGLFLFWREKRIAFRREGWAGLGGFVLGSLPLLIYNVMNGFATFRDVGGTTTWAHSWALLQVLFRHTLHFLIGTKVMYFGDSAKFIPMPTGLEWAVAAIWILGLALALAPLVRLVTAGNPGAASPRRLVGGTIMLVVMAGAAIFLFCRGDRSASQNVRYVLPIVSALPVLLAAGLDRILTWSRLAFGLLLAVLLAGQVWGNLTLARIWSDPVMVERDIHLPDTTPVRQYLADRGIHEAYANYWIAYRITFESGETIVCAEPYNQRFPGKPVKFLETVQAATNVAYVYVTARDQGFSADEFVETMAQLGIACTRTNVASFTVFHSFQAPGEEGLSRWAELPRTNWTVTATVNGGQAGAMLDANPWTRWSLGSVQKVGAKVKVDMGDVQNVGRLRIELGAWPTDFPRGYRIRTSVDGKTWSIASERGPLRWNLFWHEHHPAFISQKGDYLTLPFPVTVARYVEIELTGVSQRFDWSIAELRLFSPVPGPSMR
jgi:hypothetical protein